MICCLNPDCRENNPPYPDETQYCTVCGTELILLSGRYRPVKRIGKGGFGVTYLAEDKDMHDDHCVIKQLILDDLQSKEWFKGEAEKLKGLGKNSQIPTLLSYPTDGRYLYLVQEYIDGKNLYLYLKEKGTFTEEEIKIFLNEILPVLALIHGKEIIHRDIKLDNIMRRKKGGQLVLIDFGIAKQLASNTPTYGTTVGTPGYSPSEQMNQGMAIPACDLYSLGAACFHLLTGKHPHVALQEHGYPWTAKWRSYLDKDKDISNDLGKIIDKLLQEKYKLRYQSANDVIEAIKQIKYPLTKDIIKKSLIDKKSLIELITSLINLNTAFVALLTAGVPALFAVGIIKLPSLTADDYYKQGQELDGRDSKGAADAYTKAIETDKKYTEAYISRGIIRRDSDDNENALKDFTTAINLNPESSVSYAYRGLTFNDLTEPKKAEQDFKKVFKIEPTSSADYNARGLAWSDIPTKNDNAIKDYTKAIDYNPKFWRAYINRGMSKHRLGQYKQAVEDFTKAIDLNPRSASAYLNRGIAKFALKDTGEAIKDHTQVIKIKPNSSSAYYQRGTFQKN